MTKIPLPTVVVANLHRRYTGVSSTVANLVPYQQQQMPMAVIDTGSLPLTDKISLWKLLLGGFTKPPCGQYRLLHARRDVDMILGLFLKYILRQRWRLLFTIPSGKPPGRVLGWLISRMDAVIVTTVRSQGFINQPSTIIPHGIDMSRFRPGRRCQQENIDEFGAAYLIGGLGRVRYSKGTDLFVQALLQVLPHYPQFSAYWAGLTKPADTGFLADLQQQIQACNLSQRIHFLGQVTPDQAINLYQRSHLVVAPSRSEGFGLTPLEAMACGIGVITSDEGIWPQLICAGENGEIFTNGNVQQLIDRLDKLLGDLSALEAIGTRGPATIRQDYDVQQEARRICQLYRRLMDQG